MKVHNVNPNEPLFHDESGAAAFAEQLQELIGPVRTFFVDEEMEFDRTIFGNITYDMRLVYGTETPDTLRDLWGRARFAWTSALRCLRHPRRHE